ncbi:MAG: hypothetical protein K0U98_01975 [Deltaproteobacteria bacterium]|nr:hypothetical protein [Deltaproteobacteria bacterium]
MLNTSLLTQRLRPHALSSKSLLALLLLVFWAATSGCISLEMLVKVNGDGSGTLTQRSSVHPAFVKQATKMLGGLMGAEGEDLDLFSQESLEKMAQELGEGVTLLSREDLSREDAKGVLAVYAFEDVRKLRPGQGTLGGDDGEGLKFEFQRIGRRVSQLTATLGESLEGAEEQEIEADLGALDSDMLTSQFALIKPFLKGLKFNLSLEVEGKILETNSPNSKGSQITLLEVDLDRLLKNEAAVGKLLQDPPSSVAEAQKSLAGLPGVTVPPDNRLEVTFKRPRGRTKRK